MRLIDADAVMAAHCKDCNTDIQAGCKGDPVCASMMWVVEAPTVDAVPVVHGEWLVEAYTADDSIVVIPYRKHQHSEPFCSRCGHRALLNGCGDYVASNYCPHCGAKMGGDQV